MFFTKTKSKVEVINDTNRELMNFYMVSQTKFEKLQKMIQLTLHSRDAYHSAEIIYFNPQLFDDVKRAWAVWTLSTQGFAGKMEGPFGFDKTDNTTSKKINSKIEGFTIELAHRLRYTQIECADALYIISSRDHENAFFYCDPPYIGSNLGHYKGYTLADFTALLEMLSRIEGKFLVSSYPSEILQEYIVKNKWYSMQKEMTVTVNLKAGNAKKKIEVLTANYPIQEGNGFKLRNLAGK